MGENKTDENGSSLWGFLRRSVVRSVGRWETLNPKPLYFPASNAAPRSFRQEGAV